MELEIHGSMIQEASGHADDRATARYIHAKDIVMEAVDLLGFTYFRSKEEEKSA